MSDLLPAQPPFRRVAILFAGGPAPAANAVISTCASAFLQNGIEVIGIRHGYSRLIDFSSDQPLQEGADFLKLDELTLKRTRNARGILIGTARANPGKLISQPAHLGRSRMRSTTSPGLRWTPFTRRRCAHLDRW